MPSIHARISCDPIQYVACNMYIIFNTGSLTAVLRHLEILYVVLRDFNKREMLNNKSIFTRIRQFPLSPMLRILCHPGHPIISESNSLLEPVAQYLDYHLQTFTSHTVCFIKDTKDFVQKMENLSISEQVALVTIDGNSCYIQIRRVVMGSPLALNAASLFMSSWEETFIMNPIL